ncbi:hypothetical protein Xvie_02673 [Xenorhabdus vietnamensis]|uniref:Uncharacterized protein n=1 Tax=Xenorhabdus vietnamensis TaxID=351656 RepID=A0A1Y2SCA8_9GAMM|nr:hypothetical protein [Xenorhabdus vietnamensis]OTA15591.1 hypothetical protein Xvie_02673 [Xenorhabdus vietnamensis]
MSENYLLPPPILPQAQNGVLDKSKLNGEKIKVNVSTSPPLNLSDGDSVTVSFTDDNNESVTSTKQLQGTIGPFIKFDFSTDMLPKKYKVGYTVDDVIGDNPIYSQQVNINVINGTSTNPPNPSDKEPFIVMGARYADLAVANGLKAPQRLTAWTKDGKPYLVTWTYIGGVPSFTSPFSSSNSPFFYDSAPWLPISVSDGTNTLKINPINVFGNGGTLGLPKNVWNDPMEDQYASAFAVLLNDNTMVGWGGSFGSSYVQPGVKTITTNGPSYAGLNMDSENNLWCHGQSYNNPMPTGFFDDVGAGANSFFAVSKTTAEMRVWGAIPYTFPFPYPGDGKNAFVGNSFATALYNPNTGQIQNWWGPSPSNWTVTPPFSSTIPKPRYLTSMSRGFAVIDESGDISTWGDPDMFSGFQPPSQDFIQVAATPPYIVDSGMPTGNVAIHRDGKGYGWCGMMAEGSDGKKDLSKDDLPDLLNAVDIATTRQQFLILTGTAPHSAVYAAGLDPSDDDPVIQEFLALKNAVQITCSATASAALRLDGTVLTWQYPELGNFSLVPQPEMHNVRAIYATGTAFLALTADNKVYTWGGSDGGGDSSEVQALFDGKLTYYMD